jgi:hypothetical protein
MEPLEPIPSSEEPSELSSSSTRLPLLDLWLLFEEDMVSQKLRPLESLVSYRVASNLWVGPNSKFLAMFELIAELWILGYCSEIYIILSLSYRCSNLLWFFLLAFSGVLWTCSPLLTLVSCSIILFSAGYDF